MATVDILNAQREYFKTGETLSVKFRKKQLKLLRDTIISNQDKIYKALYDDLNKIEIESYMCEVSLVLNEIKYALKHLSGWAKKRRVCAGLANFPAKAYEIARPKGCILIMSPWNYPFMLTLEPLVDALAAGNTAIVKPSAYSPNVTRLINDLLSSTFEKKYVSVVTGGRDVNQDLLGLNFDHIFFTGSKAVGHEVLRRAEPNMTTVTLELGGKSPTIIDKSAPLMLAARRLVFGKFMNVGQTCIAPDYVLVHESVKDMFVKMVLMQIKLQYGENPIKNPEYGKMISQKHFDKAVKLLDGQNIIYGGKFDAETLKIEPTVVLEPSLDSEIMKNEIFAPILPIKSFSTYDEALEIISKNDTPLALYVFTKDKATRDLFLNKVQFGGGCVNDTIMHITTPRLAFGGVGESGMGAYHGKRGFDTFSHYKSIIDKSTRLDIPLRYRPIGKKKEKIIKKFI